MPQLEERRWERRQAVDCRAFLFWETGGGYCEVKASAVELGERGATLRGAAGLKPGAILYCAVPGHGIYTRARVSHTRGVLRRTVGLQFLASRLASA